MYKKLMLACMAITAFAAFVIAPAASASPALTESGVKVAVGSSVTATNNGVTKFTGGFGVECQKAHLQGTVTANSGTSIKGEIPVGSAKFENNTSTACSSALGATAVTVTSKLCLESGASDTLKVTGCGGNVVFDLKAAGVSCKYETASVSGTFTTNTTPASATVSEQPAKEVGGLFFCPDEGKLDMTFNLFTTGGTTGLTIS